ncbi:uncharacterized protein LOC123443945 isoform X2 [Hordeum vulgare subsp. vulgare]|nr:uncharacterized protein LOC123443945 isoform X2 [Hordeum vulgare subsp. vulgare]
MKFKAHSRSLATDHGVPQKNTDGGDIVDEEDDEDDGDEDAMNVGVGLGAVADIIYTRGVVLNDGVEQMLGVVLTIEDGYIGSHFVHRLTPTNITSKLMKIPKKFFQQLNLASQGVVGICMGVGDVVPVGHHTDCDGQMVFDEEWGVFASVHQLQVGEAVVFNFKQSSAQGINIACIMNGLRLAEA